MNYMIYLWNNFKFSFVVGTLCDWRSTLCYTIWCLLPSFSHSFTRSCFHSFFFFLSFSSPVCQSVRWRSFGVSVCFVQFTHIQYVYSTSLWPSQIAWVNDRCLPFFLFCILLLAITTIPKEFLLLVSQKRSLRMNMLVCACYDGWVCVCICVYSWSWWSSAEMLLQFWYFLCICWQPPIFTFDVVVL